MSDGLDSYKGNDIESLILRGNKILGETPDGRRYHPFDPDGFFFDKWKGL